MFFILGKQKFSQNTVEPVNKESLGKWEKQSLFTDSPYLQDNLYGILLGACLAKDSLFTGSPYLPTPYLQVRLY